MRCIPCLQIVCVAFLLSVFSGFPVLATAKTGEVEASERSGWSLQYELEPHFSDSPFIKITVKWQASDSTQSHIRLCDGPGWAGATHCAKQVQNLHATSQNGTSLNITSIAPDRWAIDHSRKCKINLSYKLVPNQKHPHPIWASRLHPVITPTFVHLIGHTSFIVPTALQTKNKQAIRFFWKLPQTEGITAHSSYGMGTHPKIVTVHLSDFRHGLWMAGSLETQSSTKENRTITVVQPQMDATLPLASLHNDARILFDLEHQFFKDHTPRPLFIGVLPVADSDPVADSINLHNSFSLIVTPIVQWSPDNETIRQIQYQLAHELFHIWNGSDLAWGANTDHLYWFSEGFTDYYARRFLERSGLHQVAHLAKDWNVRISDYTLHPYKNVPNKRIRDPEFSSDPDLHTLPYLRGERIALRLDREISKMSSGKRSLDEVMRSLVALNHTAERPVNMSDILNAFSEHTSEPFMRRLSKWIIEGRTVPLLKEDFISLFHVETILMAKIIKDPEQVSENTPTRWVLDRKLIPALFLQDPTEKQTQQ